jgi:hypothetical protein
MMWVTIVWTNFGAVSEVGLVSRDSRPAIVLQKRNNPDSLHAYDSSIY